MAEPKTKISDLRYRIALCTMRDVVDEGGTMRLSRHPIVWTWANIEMQWHLPSFISPAGYAVKEPSGVERITHHITIRAAHGLDITAWAWAYEERRKSQPRWYKVLGFGEADNWLVLACHLVEKSDRAVPPVGHLAPVPLDVKL